MFLAFLSHPFVVEVCRNVISFLAFLQWAKKCSSRTVFILGLLTRRHRRVSSQVSFDVAFMIVHRLGKNTSPSFLCIEQPRFNDSDAKFGLEKLHFYTSSFLIRTTGMKKSIDSQKTDKKMLKFCVFLQRHKSMNAQDKEYLRRLISEKMKIMPLGWL